MSVLLLLHFAAATVAPLLVRYLGRWTFLILALAPGASCIWLAAQAPVVRRGGAITETITWIPSIGLNLDLRLASLQWVLAMLVTGVGALILIYCTWYFKPGDRGLWRFGAVFTYFAGAMLGLVLADNLLLLYVFWELTTVFSYLLVGHNPVRAVNRRAAMQALLVTTFGGLAMLAGIIIIGQASTYRISALVLAPPEITPLIATGVLLMLVGALTKSAQVPFHFWLPGAMAAPTPVSAYLHAAAMVKAGIYLVALLAPIFSGAPGWRLLTIGLGVLTMLVGGWRALRQDDIKLLLAYGTVSQLGFLTAIAGIGTKAAALGAVGLVVAHALFKSTLFMTVGVIDRTTGTRDLTELSGLYKRMPVLFATAVLAGLSMAGIIPLAGFIAKETAFEAVLDAGGMAIPGWSATLLAIVLVVGSALTVAYTVRFLWGAFATKRGIAVTDCPQPPLPFLLPPLILALASLAVGFLGEPLSAMIDPYADSIPLGNPSSGLALWHGLTPALAMSLGSVVIGAVLFWRRTQVARAQAGIPSYVDAEKSYNWVIRGLERTSIEVTAITQRGSLPIYLATILTVVIAFPGMLGLAALGDGPVRAWDFPAQAAIGLIVIVSAVFAVISSHRLQTVILVGITGYGIALLFLVHGAPDIATTQILVESVSIVVFVLVLRKLPTSFRRRPLRTSRYWRMALSIAVGAAVIVFGLAATGARVAPPVSQAFPEAAYEFGHGKNVVNVTLVDIRAWDTLGEISVLVVAATGIASLIFVRTRNAAIDRASDGPDLTPSELVGSRRLLRAERTLRPERRSVIFEVITRLTFHVMIALSLYLLLAGHNLPGGGFAGGLVAGLALVVRYLAGGRYELDEAAPIDAGLLLGLGLVVAVASALAPLAFGGTVLESTVFDFSLPIYGPIHFVTPLFFDVGVYLIVVGLMLDIGRSLGSGIDRHTEQEAAA